MYKGIIFDLDGTILNTIEDICDSLNKAISIFEVKITIDQCKSFVGSGVDVLINRCLNQFELNNSHNFDYTKNKYLYYYKNITNPKTSPYDGILSLLKDLKSCGVKLAVLSNKPDDDTNCVIANNFDKTVFVEVWGKKSGYEVKPNPKSVLDLIKNLGLSNDEVLYIGDSEIDIMTATNANIKCCAVSWGFRTREVLESFNPDYIVDNPSDIIELLKV